MRLKKSFYVKHPRAEASVLNEKDVLFVKTEISSYLQGPRPLGWVNPVENMSEVVEGPSV